MLARIVTATAAILITSSAALGQTRDVDSEDPAAAKWHRAGESAAAATASRGTPTARVASRNVAPRRSVARVTTGDGTLPKKHGQVWREYDISPYTLRVTSTERPQQSIVDWVLRETGYEKWHGEPLGVLSATRRTLRVYHTPQMQSAVADLVDRFVAGEAEAMTFSLRVVTIDHPNWRSRARRLLRPVEIQTPGAGAWLLQKEDAAVLLAELRRRSDYREHSSPHLLVNNGQSTVVSAMRTRTYIRDAVLCGSSWPGFQTETGSLDEGFSLEFAPLLSIEQKEIDALIKCSIDRVEKMVPVMLDVPTQFAPRQRTKVEVPQMSYLRFEERFRWPVGEVLLVSMGMVALPVPVSSKPLVPGLPIMGSTPRRADLLVFVEAKRQTTPAARSADTRLRDAKNYHGRY